MTYFNYHIPKTYTFLIGTEKEQIINTLEYYKNERGRGGFDIPSASDITELKSISIDVIFPTSNPDHFLEARVREGITFHVNANAYHYIQDVAKDYERFKRGDLFKFQTLPLFGLFFLPEDVMQGLGEYDWKQHEKQVEEWMKIGEEMERRRILADPKFH